MEFFDIYNKYGEKTNEVAERGEAHRKGLCHRVFHLWLINAQKQILLQQRSATKDTGANLWYVSVGGHIDHGESIEEAIIRECREELGIDISGLKAKIDYLYTFQEREVKNDGTFIDDEFYDVFALRMDVSIDQIVMQQEEVQAVKYVEYADFREAILKNDTAYVPHKVGYPMLVVALNNYLECGIH